MAKGRKRQETFKWDESAGGFVYGDGGAPADGAPEYDVPEEHIKEEPADSYRGPRGEDDVLSRIRKADEKKLYDDKAVYAGKGLENLKSRSIFVESWSYHSLFPSMRTWSSLIALILAPIVALMAGVKISGANGSAMGAMLAAAFVVLIITGFLSTFRLSVSHAVKDTFIHGLVLLVVALFYPWESGLGGFVNVASIYIVSHIIAHGFDFHLERSEGRGWKLLFLVLFSTWLLVVLGYGIFNLNRVSVLS